MLRFYEEELPLVTTLHFSVITFFGPALIVRCYIFCLHTHPVKKVCAIFLIFISFPYTVISFKGRTLLKAFMPANVVYIANPLIRTPLCDGRGTTPGIYNFSIDDTVNRFCINRLQLSIACIRNLTFGTSRSHISIISISKHFVHFARS